MATSVNQLLENALLKAKDNKTMLQQLQEKIALMAAIVESTDDAIISKSLDGTINSWNKASEKIYGYTELEAIGQSVFFIVPPEEYNKENEVLEAVRNNEIAHSEIVRRKKSGEMVTVSLTATPLQDFDGKVIGASCIERDITVQKNLEDKLNKLNFELKDSNDRFQSIFYCSPVPMAMTNFESGKFQNLSESFIKLYGYTKEEVIGKTALELKLITPESSAIQIYSLIQDRRIADLEVCFRKKDGEEIMMLISAQIIKLNQTEYALWILQDINARKMMENQLKEKSLQLEQKNKDLEKLNAELDLHISEKEKIRKELSYTNTGVRELESLVDHKESILAVLSHDLRSPLTGIIGMADYLKTEYEDMDRKEVQHIISLLDESAKKELTMLDNLVEWAKIKYASDAFQPEKLNLAQFVQQAIDTIFDTAAQNEITLDNEIEAYTYVYADQKMLQSILQNVISNAVRYSEPEGNISVRSQVTGDKITVEVRGHQMQLSKTILDNLFKPDLNPLAEAKKGNSGAGIGLLLARGFLEKNRGKIWVEGLEDGESGSSFYFTLPADKPFDRSSEN